MDQLLTEPLVRLALAVGIGLLVGVERERRLGRERRSGAAGLRTFALTALLGGAAEQVGGEAILAVGFAFVAVAAVASYVRKGPEHTGLTTEIALLVTFLLGALAQRDPSVAAAIAVLVTSLLVMQSSMHRFVGQVLTEQEVHDGLLLLASALVVLPLVPDRTVGPLDVLNPFSIWRLVVLLMAVSSAGYVAVRLVGPRFGLAIAGLAGGFVSSTATVGAMGVRSRERGSLRAAVAGALASTVATFIQMAAILATASLRTLEEVALPLALGGVGAAAVALVAVLDSSSDEGLHQQTEGRAFSLRTAILLAALLTGVTFAAAAASELAGDTALLAAAITGGLADAHAAAVGIASVAAAGRLEPSTAALGVMGALTANAVSKAAVAHSGGGWSYAAPVAGGVAVSLGMAWAGLLVSRLYL